MTESVGVTIDVVGQRWHQEVLLYFEQAAKGQQHQTIVQQVYSTRGEQHTTGSPPTTTTVSSLTLRVGGAHTAWNLN